MADLGIKAREVQPKDDGHQGRDQQGAGDFLPRWFLWIQQSVMRQGLKIGLGDNSPFADDQLSLGKCPNFRRDGIGGGLSRLAGAFFVEERVRANQPIHDGRDDGDFGLGEADADHVGQVLPDEAQVIVPNFIAHHPFQHIDDLLIDVWPAVGGNGQNSPALLFCKR